MWGYGLRLLVIADSGCESSKLTARLPGFEGQLEILSIAGQPEAGDESVIRAVVERMLPEFSLVIVADSGRGELGPLAETISAGARQLAVSGTGAVTEGYLRSDLIRLPAEGPWSSLEALVQVNAK